MARTFFLLIAWFFGTTGVSVAHEFTQTRRSWAPSGFPFSSVGRLDFVSTRRQRAQRLDDFSCSATVIEHQKILTAAHCVFEQGSQLNPSQFYFRVPNATGSVLRGFRYRVRSVDTWGTQNPLSSRTLDWAVLTIETQPSTNYHPPPLPRGVAIRPRFFDRAPRINEQGFALGYSGDRSDGTRLSLSRCTILGSGTGGRQGLLESDCSFNHGASGGAFVVIGPVDPLNPTDEPRVELVGIINGFDEPARISSNRSVEARHLQLSIYDARYSSRLVQAGFASSHPAINEPVPVQTHSEFYSR